MLAGMTAITCWCRQTRVRAVFASPQRIGVATEPVAAAANERAIDLRLHPSMPEMQGYFNNQKSLAIVANVGTLVQPPRKRRTRVQEFAGESYSHSDQQDQWQSAQLAGHRSPVGLANRR